MHRGPQVLNEFKCFKRKKFYSIDKEVSPMSEMKNYFGKYSYDGTFKQQDDGSSLLEVRWFTYGGKYYQPSEPIKFVIREESDGEGWISVTDDTVGVREGGK